MGLEENNGKDRWQYDASNASWTRFIVAPRAGFFYPSEGGADERANQGPKLSNLRNCRWIIPDGVQPIKDNWDNYSGELEVNGGLVEWTGKVFFYERWASDDANGNAEDTELHAEMQWLERGSRDAHLRPVAFRPYVSVSRVSLLPGDLVLQDIFGEDCARRSHWEVTGFSTGHLRGA